MTTEDEASRRRIKENLGLTLKVLEGAFAGWIGDPNTLNHQLVNDLFVQRALVEKGDIDLSPKENLVVLEKIEKWYADQKIEYPYPEQLQQRKEYWQGKLSSNKP